MNWNSIREEDLRELLGVLQETFDKFGIDYYMIGAVAREIWYSQQGKPFRKTRDIDFAVLVGSQAEYEGIRKHLKERDGFQGTGKNAFALIAPGGIQVDILPFGGIEIDGEVHVDGIGLTNIRVNGLKEVYSTGTELVNLETTHPFRVASLPSIVLLKLIAFDDRPENRLKDARDIGNIVNNYFDLQTDLIYEHHADLFSVDDGLLAKQSLQEIASVVIGREIRKIIIENDALLQRICGIVDGFIRQKEASAFIREMVAETGQPVAEVIKWLSRLAEGLQPAKAR